MHFPAEPGVGQVPMCRMSIHFPLLVRASEIICLTHGAASTLAPPVFDLAGTWFRLVELDSSQPPSGHIHTHMLTGVFPFISHDQPGSIHFPNLTPLTSHIFPSTQKGICQGHSFSLPVAPEGWDGTWKGEGLLGGKRLANKRRNKDKGLGLDHISLGSVSHCSTCSIPI